MRRLFVIAFTAACALSCQPTQRLTATVEVTGGSVEARLAVAKTILKDLSTTLKGKVQRRLPAVSPGVLNGLHVSALTAQSVEVADDRTTNVFLECSYPPDESVTASDQKQQAVEACKQEVTRELAARTSEKRGS
jgi:hypothetical protein